MSEAAATAPYVLVVDDEPGVRSLLSEWVGRLSYRPLAASSGLEAAGAYLGHRGAVAMVILDVQIQGGDGPATLAVLRQIDPGVRCCFITGGPERYSDQELLGLGAAVLCKPFTEGQLADALRQSGL